mmetsp:Transcript_15385/g.23399  ORF Transcript_15385/g.23399 Transcript_15385/m.23399 type:complete len:83 (-) Transcript_15385:246-494(-)
MALSLVKKSSTFTSEKILGACLCSELLNQFHPGKLPTSPSYPSRLSWQHIFEGPENVGHKVHQGSYSCDPPCHLLRLKSPAE